MPEARRCRRARESDVICCTQPIPLRFIADRTIDRSDLTDPGASPDVAALESAFGHSAAVSGLLRGESSTQSHDRVIDNRVKRVRIKRSFAIDE